MLPDPASLLANDARPDETPAESNDTGSTVARFPSFQGFDQERRTYESHKAELLKDEGRYVLIKGDDVAGVWSTYEEALEAGYGRFGLQPFYVKQVAAVESVIQITRDVVPCPT
jgi:hypothetical protein